MAAADLGTADVAACFTDAWRYIGQQYPEPILAQMGTVVVTLSQTICPFFNMITITGGIEDEAALRRALATARGYAERCPHPSMLVLPSEGLPDGVADILADEGVGFSMSLWGMAADRLAPPRRHEPAIDYRITEDEATALDMGQVNADAYGMAREPFTVIGNLPGWSGRHVGVVGYVDGRAVASTLAYLLGDRIYIAMVATLPELHGQGYGEAVMRKAIGAVQVAVGEKRLWLHATEMGRPLYRSMGFDQGARMDIHAFA